MSIWRVDVFDINVGNMRGLARLMRGRKMNEEKLPHWIEENIRPKSYMWVCSECGRTAYDMPMYSKKRYVKICSLAYCPHCGVKMVGEQEVRSMEKMTNEELYELVRENITLEAYEWFQKGDEGKC